MELRGARALVTGGSGGIGLATAHLLAARGCAVTVVGSDPDRVRAAEGAVPATGVVCDFADAAAVHALGEDLAAAGAFDIVVHSAGIGLRGPAADLAGADLDRLLAVNVHAAIALTARLLPTMTRSGGGRLVFVGSIAGAVGAAGEAAYAASKAALHAYAASLRVELAHSGIGVTVLIPGVVQTGFFDRRGVPYHRNRPRPVAVQQVARALVRGIDRDRDQVAMPGWLRAPIALHGAVPHLYSRMASRWGQ